LNYSFVILVGLFVIILLLWFLNGRHRFRGPTIDWEMLKRANAME
jgi:hypothetical protein